MNKAEKELFEILTGRKKPEARAAKPPSPEQALARRILAAARKNPVDDIHRFALRGCNG
jgi:hypothetical protein